MAVRCYVGDAAVYRTLGDVDRALEAVDDKDSERVLKTIEGFAVECSINKVWTSEALAFVVDEALQVYGGYGYSKEFPAERAYRDARITRIYEGTNEINRLIIPTRLLKNEGLAHLLSTEGAQRKPAHQSGSSTNKTLFSAERDLLDRAKQLLTLTLGRARKVYGNTLANEQEVMGHIADIAIDVYVLESAILRTEKLVMARGEQASAVAIDITRVFTSDAADRMKHSAKQIMAALTESSDSSSRDPQADSPLAVDLFEEVQQLTRHTTFNTIAARRRIADSVVNAGRYHL